MSVSKRMIFTMDKKNSMKNHVALQNSKQKTIINSTPESIKGIYPHFSFQSDTGIFRLSVSTISLVSQLTFRGRLAWVRYQKFPPFYFLFSGYSPLSLLSLSPRLCCFGHLCICITASRHHQLSAFCLSVFSILYLLLPSYLLAYLTLFLHSNGKW